MSDDLAGQLRSLARAHSEGRLSLADYRARRAPLLDALVVGAADEDQTNIVTQPRTVMQAVPAQAMSASAPPSPLRNPKRAWLVLAVSVAIVIALLIWLTAGVRGRP